MLLLCTQRLLMHLLYLSSLVVIISSEKGPRPKFSFVCLNISQCLLLIFCYGSTANQALFSKISFILWWLSGDWSAVFSVVRETVNDRDSFVWKKQDASCLSDFLFLFRIILKEVTWNCIMQISSYHGSGKTAWGTDLPKIASLLLTFVYSQL